MNCFEVGPEIIIAALIYTDRLLKMNEGLVITEQNAMGLLHTALTLATKFYFDRFERNTIFHMLIGNEIHKGDKESSKSRVRLS